MTEPKSLDEALCMLQADPPVLLKDKKGQVGNQKTKYADLVQVNAVVLSRLNALGVIYKTKPTLRAEDPKFVLAYSLKHVASGTEEAGEYPLKLSENPMQMGSAITYARRYVLLAITGIAAEDEDDDGHAASGHRTTQRAAQPRQQKPAPAPQEQPTAQRAQRPAAGPPPLPGERTDGITPAQQSLLHVLLGKAGKSNREAGLGYISDVLEREITSTKELSKADTKRVIDHLQAAVDKQEQ